MAQRLKPEIFTHIIELVAPHMSSENRRTHITPWCMYYKALYGRIDWTGAERAFTTHVVELFLNHGQIEPNRSALQAFLEAVHKGMGDEDKAEIDSILQEIQSSENHLVFKSLPPQFQRATHFTGRETILADLCQALHPGKMVALCGPGGIGKTALALEAVYRLLQDDQLDLRFPDGVLLHKFDNKQETDIVLDNLLRHLGEQPLPPVTNHAQRVFTQRQLLLILDGTEGATDLPEVLDVRGNSGVLITTRTRRDAHGCKRLDVLPLPDTEAVDLLLQLVDPDSCDDETAQAICQWIGNLPLAVQLVGGHMTENRIFGEEFLACLHLSPLDALNQTQRHQESIWLLLELSLKGVSKVAHHALALIGQLASESVDKRLLALALEQELAHMPQLLGELVNLSLLRRDSNRRYEVSHTLVHTYASEHLVPSSDSLERLGMAYANFAEEQNELGPNGYNHLDLEWIHMSALVSACKNAELWHVITKLVCSAQDYIDNRGHWKQQADMLEIGLLAAKKQPDGLSIYRTLPKGCGYLQNDW